MKPQYLKVFRNSTTGRISLGVAAIIKHFYDMYGRVNPQKLQTLEDKIKQMVFDPNNPIDGIFIAINELVHYVVAADSPYSQPQIINMAYGIINKTGLFICWILKWNNKTQVQKT